MREEMLMLRKWNRILAIILAFALIATTFNSDLASVRVFADDAPEETVEQIAETILMARNKHLETLGRINVKHLKEIAENA